ncbi:MAG: stage II sporulation protein P [Caldicoprobacterales bacterium]|jgi:stage II sporulation protein P|nr:stage II sporulation protein P [Clostridiales bacterium]
MKKTIRKGLIPFLLLIIILPSSVSADDWFESEPGYYTLLDEKGRELTVMAREISVDDEYISGDNKHYVVIRVDKKKKEAYTRFEGEITLPVAAPGSLIAAAKQGNGKILLYCTHNSESYIPSDGRESIEGNGGIIDVAKTFEDNLKEKGIDAVFSDEKHDPHDAGAYRRSRQTAVRLIKENMPVRAVFDIHRDAVPKSHYIAKVNGQDMAKVRIVIGRRNQNRKANQELAYKIKAVADKAYPGLIKDIFLGRGSYNQELSPRSLLFEMGTFENSKEAVQKSTAYLADVIQKTMYGGNIKDRSEQTDESKGGAAQGKDTRVAPIGRDTDGNKGGSGGRSGLAWLLVVVAIGAVGFLLISMGGKELKSRFRGSSGQEFSSFLGRKRRKK